MKKDQIGWIILIAGAAGLAWWYFSRQSSGSVGPMAPGATVPIGSTSPSKGTITPSGTVTNQRTIDDFAGARGEYGEQARCNATGGRFIKTITAPAYGVCVSQSIFSQWLTSGIDSDQLTDQQVRAWIGNRV